MYGISSNLASQTINKRNAWACLLSLELVKGEMRKSDADRMIVEAWSVGIRVVIKKIYKGVQVIKGLSTIISPLKIATTILENTLAKAAGLNAVRKLKKVFLVDSSQDPAQKHTVIAQSYGLSCSCMKFKCLSNRLEREAPQLLKAIGEIKLLDNSRLCKTEVYNTKTRRIEEQIHVQCHHIRVVMKKFFNAFTSQEYLLNWREVMDSYRGEESKEIKEETEFFPPNNWGDYKPKRSKWDDIPF